MERAGDVRDRMVMGTSREKRNGGRGGGVMMDAPVDALASIGKGGGGGTGGEEGTRIPRRRTSTEWLSDEEEELFEQMGILLRTKSEKELEATIGPAVSLVLMLLFSMLVVSSEKKELRDHYWSTLEELEWLEFRKWPERKGFGGTETDENGEMRVRMAIVRLCVVSPETVEHNP